LKVKEKRSAKIGPLKKTAPVDQVSEDNLPEAEQPHRTRRFLLWCLANFFVWPILRPITRRIKLFQFVFVVYPGTQNNIRAYAPLWFQKMFRNRFHLSVIGIMTRTNNTGRGLIVTIPEAPDLLPSEELQKIAKRIKSFSEQTGVPSVALAGRLPTLFTANGIRLDPPFIKGEKGAVFTIVETYLHLFGNWDVNIQNPVGIVGVGYLGSKVATRLEEIGCRVIGYDIRLKEDRRKGVTLRTNNPTHLTSCKVVIILTAKGEDAREAIEFLGESALVIDDTHPQLPPDLIDTIVRKGGQVFRSTMGHEGIRAIPRLPGYDSHWIPGCVVESLVTNGGFNGNTQEEFDQKGREIGLTPFLVSPRGEG
jgi:hypothetical protein